MAHIIELRIRNIRKIESVTIRPADGSLVQITGRNGAGKSSVLDAITLGLQGNPHNRVKAPIRNGADDAEVVIQTDEMTITRTFPRAGSNRSGLHVVGADGYRYSDPQAMIDGLCANLSFDPLRFRDMSTKDQISALLDVVPIKVNLDLLAARRDDIYEQRTEAGREVARLEGAVASLTSPAAGIPEEEIVVGDILAELQAATETNRANQVTRTRYAEYDANFAAAEAKVRRLEEELATARTEWLSLGSDVEQMKPMVDALADIDTGGLQRQISELEDRNRAIRDAKIYRAHVEALVAAKGRHGALETAISDIDTEKREAIADATMPVDGLAFDVDKGTVTYNGLPFDAASAGEQIRVSAAVAMAANPQFQVILIRDGSLLDDAGLDVLDTIATERGYQVWIERVMNDPAADDGFWIVDGEVADPGSDTVTA